MIMMENPWSEGMLRDLSGFRKIKRTPPKSYYETSVKYSIEVHNVFK